jgi:NAD(P)-dependent dehydrogenase (short-subunit alcohol dehydrogenase family)
MASLAALKASNAQLTSATLPKTAVFVGGTSGIGRATLTQFINQGYPLKAYIVGRNEEEFRPVLSELRASNKTAELIFLEGQISLMAETKRLTDEILRREEHIDLLYLSAGFLPFLGREGMSTTNLNSPVKY